MLLGSSCRGSVVTKLTSIHEDAGLTQWVKDGALSWAVVCRPKMQLRSGMAVAVASTCSSDSTPSLGTSVCCTCTLKRQKNKSHKGCLPPRCQVKHVYCRKFGKYFITKRYNHTESHDAQNNTPLAFNVSFHILGDWQYTHNSVPCFFSPTQ